MEPLLTFITQYEYPAIFFLLMLGIVGLPIPDETFLLFVGFLVFTNKLQLTLAAASAFLGSLCGISVSYALGRWVGPRVLSRLFQLLYMNPMALARTQSWYERKGKYALLFGYFVPGIRHLTAFVAGASKLSLYTFAFFAYVGALVWSLSFILLGYGLGEEWHQHSNTIYQIITWVAFGVMGLVALSLFIRNRFSVRG